MAVSLDKKPLLTEDKLEAEYLCHQDSADEDYQLHGVAEADFFPIETDEILLAKGASLSLSLTLSLSLSLSFSFFLSCACASKLSLQAFIATSSFVFFSYFINSLNLFVCDCTRVSLIVVSVLLISSKQRCRQSPQFVGFPHNNLSPLP